MEHFTSFDGSDIAYLDEGAGRVVVLLHGFASDHRGNWVATGVTAALVAAGRRVVAPDARGHGRSARPHDPASYGDDAMVKDVIALFDHLGVDQVDLVGYSMGSLISAKVAACDARVRSLVLGGVGGSWAGQQRPLNGNALADALEADDPSSIDEPIPRAFRAFADSTGSDRLALAACQRSDRGEDVELSSIAVPTMVLTGDEDTLAGPPQSVAELIPGARFEVVNGNHLTVVRDPEFTRSLISFVTESR
ncbi:MAG: alpha/beta fold hydrolase [Acidimicrobiales bacterium]